MMRKERTREVDKSSLWGGIRFSLRKVDTRKGRMSERRDQVSETGTGGDISASTAPKKQCWGVSSLVRSSEKKFVCKEDKKEKQSVDEGRSHTPAFLFGAKTSLFVNDCPEGIDNQGKRVEKRTLENPRRRVSYVCSSHLPPTGLPQKGEKKK